MAAGGADPTAAERPGSVPLLAVLGLVLLGACVLVAITSLTDRRGDLVEEEARTAAERKAGEIAVALRDIEASVEHLDPSLCAPDPDSDQPVEVVAVTPAEPPPLGAALFCLPADDPGDAPVAVDRADPSHGVALAQSRDLGVAVLSAPSPELPPMVASPIYLAGGQLSLVPSDRRVSVRRAELAGHAVAVIDVVELLGDDADWELTDAGTVLGRSGSTAELDEEDRVSAEVAALERRWTLAGPVPAPPVFPRTVVAVAVLGALGAALLGLADRQRRLAARADVLAMAQAEQRAKAIRTLTGIVQHSQDLDQILPALAVQLSDELGLDGLSLAVTTAGGTERAIFTHATRPDGAVRPGNRRPGRVRPGATVAFDLHRAERSIAVLRVVAGRELDAGALELLEVAAEMITSTIVAGRSIEQQQEAVDRLESLDELKTTFLGVASHELRTPATAISGLATLLATRWDALTEDDRRAFASRIATNADALNALVQDLLDFARLERGDLQLALAPVVLSDTVDAVLDRLDGVWGSHGVTRAIDPGIEVLGDVSAIERIVTNLVSNAVKFSPTDADVSVSVQERDGRAVLLVDDSGPGVPLEEREKIFVRFFRGAGDSVVRTRGVGIGLSVVQDFVAQMGGSVRVEDSPLGGARFVVELDVLDHSKVEERDAATT